MRDIGVSRSKRSALLALSSIPLIMTLGNSMLIPVLPDIRHRLDLTYFQTSMIITVFSIMAILFIPPAGYLSDRIGRKKVIVPCLILAGVGGAICASAAIWSANPYPYMLIGRVLQGLGAAGAAPIVMPLVGDMFKRDEEVSAGLGLIETSNTFGKVLSPMIGSLLAAFVWYAPFIGIPVFAAISVTLVALLVKAPPMREKPLPAKAFLRGISKLFRQRGRWLFAVFALGGAGMFMLFAFLVHLSDVLEDHFGLHGFVKGSVLAIPLAVLCSASYITGKVIGENKRRMKLLSTAGFILSAAASAACILWSGIVMYLVLLSVAGLGIGVALPCLDAFITEGIEKEQRGTVSSFYSSMRFAGVALGPPAASLLGEPASEPLFWCLAGVGLASALASWRFIRPGEPNPRVYTGPKLVGGPSPSRG